MRLFHMGDDTNPPMAALLAFLIVAVLFLVGIVSSAIWTVARG